MNHAYSIIIVLALTMVLFIWGRWRYDLVALIALCAATVIGAVPISQIFSGLDNPAVITVACVMIISKTITNSGILNRVIHRLGSLTHSATMHVAILSFAALFLSGFMNNIGALALIMPVAIKTALAKKRSPSFILMPIAFASALGGLITMIGTPPNLIISAFRERVTGSSFTMFDFTPVGILVAVIGVLFIVFLGFRLLPKNRKAPKSMADIFDIEDYIFEIKLTAKSNLLDLKLSQFTENTKVDFTLLGMIRDSKKHWFIPEDFTFKNDDILIIETSADNIDILMQETKTQLASKDVISKSSLTSKDINLMEVVIPPGARVEGRTVQALRLYKTYGIQLIAISREGKPFKKRLTEVKLQAGDVLLLQGPESSMPEQVANMGFLPLSERALEFHSFSKMYLPIITFLVAIIITALQIVPVQAAFGATVLVIALFNWLPLRQLYESVDWPIIILLAAMLPVGMALQTSGGTTMIANALVHIARHLQPVWILLILMLITMTLSDFMNNAATAIIMAPIAYSIATDLHVHTDPFLMGIAVACSCSFLTPIGHQNNTLVMGPGGYKFSDYLRLGLPVELIVLLVSVPAIMWFWPLH